MPLESLLALIEKNSPTLLLWAVLDRARLAAEVAGVRSVNPAWLPYDREFVHWLAHERNLGPRSAS